jgi:hypothetical protein
LTSTGWSRSLAREGKRHIALSPDIRPPSPVEGRPG